MKGTYRDELNEMIDSLGIFTTRKNDGSIRLERGFYVSKDLLNKVKFKGGLPMEEIHRKDMESFGLFVGKTRQLVRSSIINNGKYIILRKGYYNIDGLIVFLENFNGIKNEE